MVRVALDALDITAEGLAGLQDVRAAFGQLAQTLLVEALFVFSAEGLVLTFWVFDDEANGSLVAGNLPTRIREGPGVLSARQNLMREARSRSKLYIKFIGF